MATPQSIKPFPADIDRDAFGHWLAGFTDGEGNFDINLADRGPGKMRNPNVKFCIRIRSDDRPVLELIQSFFGYGRVTSFAANPKKPKTNPTSTFITGGPHTCHVAVNLFDRYPLRAKKARDFAIWREAVLLCIRVISVRPRSRRDPSSKAPSRVRRWSVEELKHFAALADLIKKQRQYQVSDLTIPPMPKRKMDTLPLFD